VLRIAVVEDLRLLVEVVRDHDVRIAELDRVQQLVEEAADGGAAVAVEGVVDLLAALLVVRAALLLV
jgi:peptide deformylase